MIRSCRMLCLFVLWINVWDFSTPGDTTKYLSIETVTLKRDNSNIVAEWRLGKCKVLIIFYLATLPRTVLITITCY